LPFTAYTKMNVALVSGTSRYVCQLQASPTHYYKYSITHRPLEASPCTRRPEPGRIISTTVMMDCHPPPNTSPQNPDDACPETQRTSAILIVDRSPSTEPIISTPAGTRPKAQDTATIATMDYAKSDYWKETVKHLRALLRNAKFSTSICRLRPK
jgi:hypothetical protein